jgi:hypothetical protein
MFSRRLDVDDKLESEVNEWLAANPQHDIETILQSSTSWQTANGAVINVTVTIVYYHREKPL